MSRISAEREDWLGATGFASERRGPRLGSEPYWP